MANMVPEWHTYGRAAAFTPGAKRAYSGTLGVWGRAAEQLRRQFPKVAEAMDEAENEVLAHMAYPAAVWSKISSTNPLERINKEIKRREPRVGIFPNNETVTRLSGRCSLSRVRNGPRGGAT